MHTHIIFDLDGTLIESLPGIAAALNTALALNNLPTHPVSAVRTFIGDGSHTLCKRAAPNQPADIINSVHETFLQQYPLTWKNGTHIYPGIQALLTELTASGKTLSILSNKPHHFTTEMVDHFFPAGTFDLILGQRDHIEKKPDPSGIHEILNQLSIPTKNAILIGDSTIDLITAKNANIASLAVTWGYHDQHHLESESPTKITHSVAELKTHLLPQITA